ncbi:unnamed protein product [Didymodactylos carnosus]|uniref:Uncharacterized protein n=1 Tax=Didymodactylos carnosus TaxID=1234261 RepID=A0A815ZLZ9_9BILA|nr:unnamed protein product [Didymodactylos carnosus]CAF4454158.1 unnamed protein product [Didymodactylos carnosus]
MSRGSPGSDLTILTQISNITLHVDVIAAEVGTQTDIETNTPLTTPSPSHSSTTNNDSIRLPFFKLSKLNSRCSICDIYFAEKNIRSVQLNGDVRTTSLLNYHILIPEGSRCCYNHLNDGNLNQKDIDVVNRNKLNECNVNREKIIKLFDEMKQTLTTKRERITELNEQPPLDFDQKISDHNCHVLTVLTKTQFNDLCSHIPLSALSILDSATTALGQHFVQKHLGFDHISRQDVIKYHIRPLAQQLLADNDQNKVVIILDGTYIYIQKSQNNILQRRTFSSHKVPYTMIEKIGDYFATVCALINCYRPVFVRDTRHDREIGDRILELADETNKMKTYIDKLKDKQEKLKWVPMNAANVINDFPKMTFDELQELTLSCYQLKQSKAYTTEHLDQDGSFLVKVTNQKQD